MGPDELSRLPCEPCALGKPEREPERLELGQPKRFVEREPERVLRRLRFALPLRIGLGLHFSGRLGGCRRALSERHEPGLERLTLSSGWRLSKRVSVCCSAKRVALCYALSFVWRESERDVERHKHGQQIIVGLKLADAFYKRGRLGF